MIWLLMIMLARAVTPAGSRVDVVHGFSRRDSSTRGIFGKFLLLKSVLERGAFQPACYWLVGLALVRILISFYYYLGVVRAIFWATNSGSTERILISEPSRAVLLVCISGLLYLGLLPSHVVDASAQAVQVLKPTSMPRAVVRF